MAIIHGGSRSKSLGIWFGGGGALMQIVPHILSFQNFKNQVAGITMRGEGMDKNVAQNSPKHAISTGKKQFFFWGGPSPLSRPILVVGVPARPHSLCPTKPSGCATTSSRIPARLMPMSWWWTIFAVTVKKWLPQRDGYHFSQEQY